MFERLRPKELLVTIIFLAIPAFPLVVEDTLVPFPVVLAAE